MAKHKNARYFHNTGSARHDAAENRSWSSDSYLRRNSSTIARPAPGLNRNTVASVLSNEVPLDWNDRSANSANGSIKKVSTEVVQILSLYICAPGFNVGDVGQPFEFGRQVGQVAELFGGERRGFGSGNQVDRGFSFSEWLQHGNVFYRA